MPEKKNSEITACALSDDDMENVVGGTSVYDDLTEEHKFTNQEENTLKPDIPKLPDVKDFKDEMNEMIRKKLENLCP